MEGTRTLTLAVAIVFLIVGFLIGFLSGWFGNSGQELPRAYRHAIAEEDPDISKNFLVPWKLRVYAKHLCKIRFSLSISL